MTWTLQWILWNWHLFLLFLKDTKKRDIATLGRSSNAIQKPLLYGSTHVSPSSVHIRGLTVPLTLPAFLADFSWCLLGFFPFGSVPTSLSLMTVDSLFRSAFLADFALSLPPFPKNLLPQNSCKIDKVFPSGRHTLGYMAKGPSQWNEDEQTGTISLMWHILLWGLLYQKCLRQVTNKHCPFNEKVERFVNKPLGHLFLVSTAVKKREQNSILKKAGPNKLQNQTNARTTSPNLK